MSAAPRRELDEDDVQHQYNSEDQELLLRNSCAVIICDVNLFHSSVPTARNVKPAAHTYKCSRIIALSSFQGSGLGVGFLLISIMDVLLYFNAALTPNLVADTL